MSWNHPSPHIKTKGSKSFDSIFKLINYLLRINSRFFVEHHEAQQVSVVWRPEGFPFDHYFIAQGSNLGKLQHMSLT